MKILFEQDKVNTKTPENSSQILLSFAAGGEYKKVVRIVSEWPEVNSKKADYDE